MIASGGNLRELKGTRKSIGGIQNESIQFHNQKLTLHKGDLLYLGSDGLEDQNDIKRKKFGRNNIKKLLMDIMDLPLVHQKNKVDSTLDNHMQGTDQRDDILWMGIRM